MKFLKTIRLDPSDRLVFDNAAAPDEWALAGGFLFSNAREDELKGKQKQAFSNGFLSLQSFGFSTFVSVAEINASQIEALSNDLSHYFIKELGAPSLKEAQPVADAEIQFTLDMCQEVALNSLFTLRRFFDTTGTIKEEFRIVKAPSSPTHTRVWEIVEDE